jgi:hypothetical protein
MTPASLPLAVFTIVAVAAVFEVLLLLAGPEREPSGPLDLSRADVRWALPRATGIVVGFVVVFGALAAALGRP